MSETKRRHTVRDKDVNQLFNDFSQKLSININQLFPAKIQVEVAEGQTIKIYFINQRPSIAIWKNVLLPTLLFKEVVESLPKIVVNMGAVPHVTNGADIMAPGVVRIEKDYEQNDFVVVTDERHNKPLAIAIALIDSKEAQTLRQGKIAKNLHYVGDSLWNELKKMSMNP